MRRGRGEQREGGEVCNRFSVVHNKIISAGLRSCSTSTLSSTMSHPRNNSKLLVKWSKVRNYPGGVMFELRGTG